jgi:hypothetical protein
MLALATHIPVSAWLAEDPETIATAVHILQEQERRRK